MVFSGLCSNPLTLPHRFRTIPPYESSLSPAGPGQARQLHGHHLQGRPQEKWPDVVYLRALKALKSTGTALDLAAHQFADSVKVLGGASLLEATRYYIRRHPTKLPRKTVQEVVDEFIDSRRQEERSSMGARYFPSFPSETASGGRGWD
jgi:hypothetical protein